VLRDNVGLLAREADMPQSSSSPQPSFLLEIILATCVGATLGLLTGNFILGSGVGIALGAVLSVIKLRRQGGQR
jgi:hypothetical protein